MTMEHRWKRREPVNLDVEVYKDGALLGAARALDVSAGGMGLACRFGLRVNDVVEVQLPEEGHYGYANLLRQTITKPHSASFWTASPQDSVAQAGWFPVKPPQRRGWPSRSSPVWERPTRPGSVLRLLERAGHSLRAAP